MSREPIFNWGMVTSFITATLALLVAFGIHLTNAQQVAVLGVAAALGPIVTALITWWQARKKTTPIA